MFIDGLSLVNFGHLSFVDREWFLPTAALTLENIGWHPCSNSLVRLQEWCAESCGGVKVEADFKFLLVQKSSDTPASSAGVPVDMRMREMPVCVQVRGDNSTKVG